MRQRRNMPSPEAVLRAFAIPVAILLAAVALGALCNGSGVEEHGGSQAEWLPATVKDQPPLAGPNLP